jgi:hypothetical protein
VKVLVNVFVKVNVLVNVLVKVNVCVEVGVSVAEAQSDSVVDRQKSSHQADSSPELTTATIIKNVSPSIVSNAPVMCFQDSASGVTSVA